MTLPVKLLLLWLFFFSCEPIENKTPNKKKIFLLAGQSNMDGRANGGLMSISDINRLEAVANRFEFYYNHEPVTPLKLTTPLTYVQEKFNLSQSFGPEIFFGIELGEQYPNEEFVIIKKSSGGASLQGSWNPNWSEEKAKMIGELDKPRLFNEFLAYVRQVLVNYRPEEYEINGMLWVQGETDSNVNRWGAEPANNYGTNLQNLIEGVREELNCPNLSFYIFQVGSGKVVEGMKQVADSDENIYLIPQSDDKNSPDFYVRNPPPIGHYTASSMKRIGEEFFKSYENANNNKCD